MVWEVLNSVRLTVIYLRYMASLSSTSLVLTPDILLIYLTTSTIAFIVGHVRTLLQPVHAIIVHVHGEGVALLVLGLVI